MRRLDSLWSWALLLPPLASTSPYGTTTYPPYNSRRTLPILVAILAIVIGIVGVFVLLAGLFMLLAGLDLAIGGRFPLLGRGYFPNLVLAGGFYFILGAVEIATARGLWDLEAWALWLTAIIVFLLMVGSFFVSTLLFLLFLVLFIYLLAVRKHFL